MRLRCAIQGFSQRLKMDRYRVSRAVYSARVAGIAAAVPSVKNGLCDA